MRRQAIVGWILVCCLALGFGASTSLGQAVYGSIIGTVTDPQGNAVAGAKVTVTSVTKSLTFDTTTNESGNYSVTHFNYALCMMGDAMIVGDYQKSYSIFIEVY